MSLVGFNGQNHPQQVGRRGAKPEVDNLETPWEFFTPLNERFGFTLDACALPHNAKCDRYFTPDQDGLLQSWEGERVWCNPPYSQIEPWVAKAHESGAELVVMLLPANRTEQGWWQRQVEPQRRAGSLAVEFLSGRLRFIKHGHDRVEPNQRPPFGCCLLIFDRPQEVRDAA
jgi:phage N-6-adenine-methyltransferase